MTRIRTFTDWGAHAGYSASEGPVPTAFVRRGTSATRWVVDRGAHRRSPPRVATRPGECRGLNCGPGRRPRAT
jgi:hypothetical protein